MFQDDLFYYACGIGFAVFGYTYLEEANRHVNKLGSKVFVMPFSIWFCYEYGKMLFESGDPILQAIPLLAAFCIFSPLIGYIWYGEGGKIRKNIFRGIRFLFLWGLITFGTYHFMGKKHEREALIVGFLVTFAVFLLPTAKKKWQTWNRSREQRAWANAEKRKEYIKSKREEDQKQKDDELIQKIIEEMKK